MGVEVRTGAPVKDVVDGALVVGDETIEVGGAILWAAGVRASPAAAWVGAPTDRGGRIPVNPDFSLPGRPDIFVVGDTAAVHDANGREAPGLAAAAKQMGRHVGQTILARSSGRPDPAPFRYKDYGTLATIGRNSAIVSVGRIDLTGFVGWLFWSAVHIYFLIGLRSRLAVAMSWAWSYMTDQRGARVIMRQRDVTPEKPPLPS